ncbi:MAG: gatA [Gammaproteobacteria bacterium]|jgi:aspartyl-tRNA(Asn)/glutamyl-tRNA(Gln) amidotransferase subunit A|nr:gatA [Gammaproteobacteria bacterium]
MHQYTLAELSRLLHSKAINSVELTQHYLNRIKQYNTRLNCLITITEEEAMVQAKKADACIQQGKSMPLTGIPIIHKDIFCTQGIKTTCASKMLDNFIAPYDATVVSKLNIAGMVLLGKANMDEFAMGSSNENSFYGQVKNPWDETRVPGGSSGGSAAAVAARLTPSATGTDTGGSIRQPAALSGITGLKPTYGRVSRYGMIAYASSLDQGGPLATTAEDCAYLLQTMAGFDPYDSTSVEREVPDYLATLNNPLKGLRIGLVKEYFSEGLSAAMREAIYAVAKTLEKEGATLVDISLKRTALSMPAYYVIAPAECSSNLSRFDGVRYGYRCENPHDLNDLYARSRQEGFGEEVKRRILIGTYVLSAGYYDAYYLKAQQCRRLIHDDFQDAFKSVDVILSPTSPTTAFKLGEKTKDPISMYLSDQYTLAVNLAGLPGLSMPAGFIDNLPVGAQLIGNHFTEARLLNIAHRYQQLTNWHKQMPALAE